MIYYLCKAALYYPLLLSLESMNHKSWHYELSSYIIGFSGLITPSGLISSLTQTLEVLLDRWICSSEYVSASLTAVANLDYVTILDTCKLLLSTMVAMNNFLSLHILFQSSYNYKG